MPMSINVATSRMAAYPAYTYPQNNSAVQQSSSGSYLTSREALLGLTRLIKTIEELENNISFSKSKEPGVSELISNQDLGLYTGATTATTLSSTEDINNYFTSYSPEQPAWQSFTSSDLTLHGTYDGTNGSGTAEFTVSQGGFRSVSAISIDVSLPNGGGTETITTSALDPASTIYTLSNGLGISLSAGYLADDDVASTTISLSTTESINPDNPFNGVDSNGPHFENEQFVSSGSFQVNGAVITVTDTDSVNSILSKINASSAGVTATFDAESEIIHLTHNTSGSANEIILSNDTSGFLEATKLANATQVRGLDHEPDMPFSSVSVFNQVSSGTLAVNGSNIALDVNSDTLNSVLSELNNAPGNVSAELTNASQRVSIAVLIEPYTLSLSSGSTQLFPSLKIADGDYLFKQTETISSASRKRSYRAANELKNFQAEFADAAVLLRQSAVERTNDFEEELYAIQEDYTKRYGAAALQSFGIKWRDFDQGLIDYSEATRKKFTKALQRNDKLEHILVGKNDADAGLLEQISTTIEAFVIKQARAGGHGQIVSLYA
ncbi:flagellin hook IN motif-containing protein [Granulosicoccus antarcticus]|uniref:Flagellar hook-associated protein 2 C-terminal domain-containing protein n=1 Tax=Granulosicoccus antarcticus IMCC3135 TaxID=1192854 RepID=A0A2Z2NX72_9GAMM|nr:flagellin hook IN motif-containing protein [Granulosicoccus antarcticus]ASJ75833.1 hypothetical protein IMCC3135_28905 [Granulosicoccus antarcticus IMCC3135]